MAQSHSLSLELIIIDTAMFRNEIFGMNPKGICSLDR
jgi:hypothetical protein